jgi:hypothetical protein
MNTHVQSFDSDALAASEPAAPLSNRIRSISLRLMVWVDTCADYYAAAAMYEQLSALSDSELARRRAQRWLARHATTAMRDGERARHFANICKRRRKS